MLVAVSQLAGLAVATLGGGGGGAEGGVAWVVGGCGVECDVGITFKSIITVDNKYTHH